MSELRPEEFITGTGQHIKNVHPRDMCEGEFCSIHNPSDHHMRPFPTHYLSQLGMMFRLCNCLRLHPDPDSVEYFKRSNLLWHSDHDCCSRRCCQEVALIPLKEVFTLP